MNQLMDLQTVARRLGTTERHLRRLVAERRIPHVKVGGLLRFDAREIDEWLDAHRRPPVTPRQYARH